MFLFLCHFSVRWARFLVVLAVVVVAVAAIGAGFISFRLLGLFTTHLFTNLRRMRSNVSFLLSYLFPLDFVCCLVILLERLLVPFVRSFIIKFAECANMERMCIIAMHFIGSFSGNIRHVAPSICLDDWLLHFSTLTHD